MVGSYSLANFDFASDGSGGTLVTDPPAGAAHGGSVQTASQAALLLQSMAASFGCTGGDGSEQWGRAST
jgi:hypothetical protein